MTKQKNLNQKIEFEKELERRIEIIKIKYGKKIKSGSWSGIYKTITDIDELDELFV